MTLGPNPDAHCKSASGLQRGKSRYPYEIGRLRINDFFDNGEVARRMREQRFTLCLSGHTHRGQVTFGGWAPFRPVGSGRFVSGFYDVPGCRLYVSKGLGTSVLPVRWGARAEVAVFDL